MQRFGRVRRGVANATLGYGVGISALGVGVASLLLLNGWIPYSVVNVLLALAAFVALVGLLVRLCRGWERRRTAMTEAFQMEALVDGLNSRIVSALDFLGWPESSPLTDIVIEHARQDLEQPFEEQIDRAARNRLRLRFALMLVVFVGLGLTPWFSFTRVRDTVVSASVNLRETLFPTQYELLPGAGQHVYLIGTEVETGLRFTRFRYPEVALLRREGDSDEEERVVLPVDESGQAVMPLRSNLAGEHHLRFAFGKRVTESITVVFTSPPLIENMQVELIYPNYTRQLPKETEGIQNRFTALTGTRVNLGFVFTKPLEAAQLTFDDDSNMPLDVVGRFASVSFVHSQERLAKLQVKDVHGFGLESLHAIDMGVTPDRPPRLILPKFLGLDMPATVEQLAGFTFGARIEDDFGAAKCVVKWQKATVEEPNTITFKGDPVERSIAPPRPTAVAAFESLFSEQAELSTPGDLFTFQVEAFDNREPKPQKTVSPMFSIFIRGVGPEDGLAGSSADVMAKFSGPGGRGAKRVQRQPEGSRAIGMPQGLRTAVDNRSDFKAVRQTTTRGERRGDGTTSAYGAAISGAK
ncbi:MAG: hypothetical protein QGH31_09250 [Kiritimatiellia bacterium]|jgi:hypothetical protein|nr:hypothetical protein [Kiritimatiellia bacterium]